MSQKARTLDDVILWPNDDEKVTQFKCTKCNCINVRFPGHIAHTEIVEKGYGLVPRQFVCLNIRCSCHTGVYPLPRILSREVSLDEALGVPNGK